MKRKNTTRLLLHNVTTGEQTILKNLGTLTELFNIDSRETVVNWFRESKIVRKRFNGYEYVIHKADSYLY